MKRSSVLFTELDRRLSLSNNNQNKRKYKGGTAKMPIFDIFDIFGRIFWAFLAFFRGEK